MAPRADARQSSRRVSLRIVGLAAAVCTAGLVPLFGDPRATPLTHPLWARMLLRSLDLTEAVRVSAQASQVFSALAWRESLSFPAEHYLRARDAVVRDVSGLRVVTAAGAPAEVTYPLAVVQGGEYHLRALLAGAASAPATAEIVPLAGGAAIEAYTLVPPAKAAWVFGGATQLGPGAYGARFLLPAGCGLAQVEIAPPCLEAIEPPGGWKATSVTTTQDLAVTALQALDRQHELAPAALPVEVAADAFQIEGPAEAVEARARAAGIEATTLRAGRAGLRALAIVDLPETGLYAVSGLVAPGAGQRWSVDACRTALVCPGERAGWRAILSQSFVAGRHHLLVTLGTGSRLERVRFERKRNAAADYVAALRRVGFDPGPAGPVSRTTALDAARFVRDERRAALAAACTGLPPIEEAPTALPTQVAGTAPATPPFLERPKPVEPPVGPPVLPPQQPATPTLPNGS